jgi:hypothetical protein
MGGIIVGGAMNATTLAGRRLLSEYGGRFGEFEAGLSIGLMQPDAFKLVAGPVAGDALLPSLDQTRTVGLVTLPGAFVGMVLGGALGNILDRTRHGYVVDFADLHFGVWRPFLIFNVGDAAISIGVVMLLLRAFLTRKERPEGSGPEETIEHA